MIHGSAPSEQFGAVAAGAGSVDDDTLKRVYPRVRRRILRIMGPSDDLEDLVQTTMETLLPVAEADWRGRIIPVWLQSRVTEVGTLELWCVSREDQQRWKLEFNLREREPRS